MTCPSEPCPTVGEGIDRQLLTELRGRFLAVNQGRLARAMEGLALSQQTLLELMALFFHVNHPSLPGYVSDTTPAGVAGYEPATASLTTAMALFRGFACAPRVSAHAPIQGLFLMGSLGTLAQTDQSDIDVWICHDPGLGKAALQALRKKCQRLEHWAAGQGGEVHFFLIHAQRLAEDEHDIQLSAHHDGVMQPTLLLDEFYRTAIWLAGRTPLWWWVPRCEEGRYDAFTQRLLARRALCRDDVIDLGHLAHVPVNEFQGAGQRQLLKGLESPYKSVLKLLLIEVYASEYPRVNCLSLHFKHAVYTNRLDLDELDPYVMVYRRIEHYLKGSGDLQRLELVRRSLYLKANCKLSDTAVQPATRWQHRVLARLTAEWGWDERQLSQLDNHAHWETEQACHERLALARELSISYRFLDRFSRKDKTLRVPAASGYGAK